MAKPKKTCVVCNREMGFLSSGATIKDGVICVDCQTLAKLKNKQFSEHDSASLKAHIAEKNPEYFSAIDNRAAFNATKNIEKYLYVDEGNKKFMVGKDGVIFAYADLIGYELLEDNETITKGGLGGAVVGGLIAGSTGALVGAAISGKKSKSTCDALDIKLTVKNYQTDAVYIRFIGVLEKGIKTNNIIYKVAKENAQKCLSALMLITDENDTAKTPPVAPAVDVAAELQKFHDLKEKGILTEDEFNAKKAQLLGL